MERKVEALGPTGARVADRLTELRRAQELTQGQLAEKLRELGRPIAVAALSKIEKGLRRVDADDLIALSLALGVSPNELLLPDPFFSDPVELTPTKNMGAAEAWQWAAHNPEGARGVFISYARRDRDWAEWIAWTLKNAGILVRLDVWDLSPGMSWNSVLTNNIKNAKCVIALLSSNYVSSEWTRHEWTFAEAAGRRQLLPVCIEHFDMPKAFAQYQYLDLVSSSEEQARQQLLESVKLFGERPQVAGQSETPEFPGT
ncbi:TIR domain-containing protein [Streptomyces sp. NPDC002835]